MLSFFLLLLFCTDRSAFGKLPWFDETYCPEGWTFYDSAQTCFIASDTDVFPYFSITSNNRTLKIWFYALWNMLITHKASYIPMDHIGLILRSLKKRG